MKIGEINGCLPLAQARIQQNKSLLRNLEETNLKQQITPRLISHITQQPAGDAQLKTLFKHAKSCPASYTKTVAQLKPVIDISTRTMLIQLLQSESQTLYEQMTALDQGRTGTDRAVDALNQFISLTNAIKSIFGNSSAVLHIIDHSFAYEDRYPEAQKAGAHSRTHKHWVRDTIYWLEHSHHAQLVKVNGYYVTANQVVPSAPPLPESPPQYETVDPLEKGGHAVAPAAPSYTAVQGPPMPPTYNIYPAQAFAPAHTPIESYANPAERKDANESVEQAREPVLITPTKKHKKGWKRFVFCL